MGSPAPATIVPWFSRGQYPDILATMADAVFLPQTHDAWRRGFEERLRTLRQGNVEAQVVRIDPRAFRIWCEAEELPCNAESRLEFAELLAEMEKQADGSFLLVENHCPICAAATECQGFCKSELDVFRRTLGPGRTVERVEHALAGARRCVYRITPV